MIAPRDRYPHSPLPAFRANQAGPETPSANIVEPPSSQPPHRPHSPGRALPTAVDDLDARQSPRLHRLASMSAYVRSKRAGAAGAPPPPRMHVYTHAPEPLSGR